MEKKLTERKKILANRVYSDSTLKKWSKKDLIEQIRILEHNWANAEQNLAQSVKNSEKIFYEQKAEIERLTQENRVVIHNMNFHRDEKFELQKQVDELTDKLGKVLLGVKMDEMLVAKGIEQAVKDTAKEIWITGKYYFEKHTHKDVAFNRFADWIKEHYGVEV